MSSHHDNTMDRGDVDGEEKADEKHRWDAKDLEKVAQFNAGEGDEMMGEVSKEALGSLQQTAAAQKEINRIVLRKEDIQLLVTELDMPRFMAENKLIEHKGDIKAAVRDLLTH